MFLNVLFFLFIILSAASKRCDYDDYRTKMIIDQDGGADDAMAIFIALLNEQKFNGSEVIGLTTTHGNVGEDQVYINSQRILGVANRMDVPIYRGSKSAIVRDAVSDYFFGRDGLGDHEHVQFKSIPAEDNTAVLALIELSKQYEGNLEIVAIGPLTNIALAIKVDPLFLSRLSRLVIGAGHIYSDKFKEAEFNVQMDVEAYSIVVEAATPQIVTVLPFSQVLTSINITREWRKNVLGAVDSDIIKIQNSYERLSLKQKKLWTILDPVVMSAALDDTILQSIEYSNNSVALCGTNRGIITNDFKTKPNVKLWSSINQENYKQFLLRVFGNDSKTNVKYVLFY